MLHGLSGNGGEQKHTCNSRNWTLVIQHITYMFSHHSAAEYRASTRILHLTLFLASVLISAQVFWTFLASSSTVLHHVFLGLPLPRLPCGFHSRACLAMSSDGAYNILTILYYNNFQEIQSIVVIQLINYYGLVHILQVSWWNGS
jgi:hypothetical protein